MTMCPEMKMMKLYLPAAKDVTTSGTTVMLTNISQHTAPDTTTSWTVATATDTYRPAVKDTHMSRTVMTRPQLCRTAARIPWRNMFWLTRNAVAPENAAVTVILCAV